MDLSELRETSVWTLYEKGRNFHRMKGYYTDTDRNYRFFDGNQWEGAKLGDVEPVQKNFIKPVVKYKLAVIHDNLYAINFSSMNYSMPSFRKQAEKCCELLNGYTARIWERDKMDKKLRKVTKDAAINGEGIFYSRWDAENTSPINEVVDKCDVYYGDEQNDNIQEQPYILIRKRMPLINALELADEEGISEGQREYIVPDKDTFEQSGDNAKDEVNDQVTLVYKMYKKDGTVRYSLASRFAVLVDEADTGLSRYPIAHMNWEDVKNSARGIGEVKPLIPNQIEVNRTEMRRVLTVKSQAYPHKVVDGSKVSNPQDLNKVGGVIKTKGNTVDDVRKVVGTIPPAQMSADVKLLQDDLIQMSRDLAGAGDSATGDIDPESTSGRAIIAVQQAQKAPVTEQRDGCKNLIEDIALIWLDMFLVYAKDGIPMEEKVIDSTTSQETYQVVVVSPEVLKKVKATVKIDITPKSPFDKLALEQTLENLLTGGYFHPQKLPELKAYAEALPDDAVSPKMIILDYIDNALQEQRKIATINAQAQMMEQRADHFFASDPDEQASEISAAEQMVSQAVGNNNPDDN